MTTAETLLSAESTRQAAVHLDALLDDDHPTIREASHWMADHDFHVDGFDREWWRMIADAGFLGLHMPVSAGGSGKDPVAAMLTFEGLGRGATDMGRVFAAASQLFATQTAILQSATDDQRDSWLRPLIDGSRIMGFAMSEPHAGSDTAAMSTTAEPVADGYLLTGTKTWITLAPVADDILVFAKTDPSLGAWGVSALRVSTSAPGVTVSQPIEKMGLTSCPFGRIDFDQAWVPKDSVLGAVGAGQRIFTAAVETERIFLYAAQLGRMSRLLEIMVGRATTRQQFGQSIGSFQSVAHRIADVKLQLEAARLLAYKAAIAHTRGEPVTMHSALAKLQVSEHAVTTALSALQLHGAEGYTIAAGIEREVRDALAGLSYSGTSDIQKNIIARLLGVNLQPRST